MDSLKLILHDYNRVKELSDEELKNLISEIVDIEEIPSALEELFSRMPDAAMELGKKIVESNLGDEFLQAAIIEFIFDHDKQYIVDFIQNKFNNIDHYVFGCILDCLSIEAMQPFGNNLSKSFIGDIVNRYNVYDKDKKSKIEDKMQWFLNSYSNMV